MRLYFSKQCRLFDVDKLECRSSWHGILTGQALTLLTSTNNLTSLATLINSNDLNLLETRGALQTTHHLGKNDELIEGKLAIEDSGRGLASVDQTALQVLNKGHGLLHLTELANLCAELLVVEGEVQRVERIADQVNVLLLPVGELLGNEDDKLLGLAGVEGNVLALGELLGEVTLGAHDVACGTTDVVLSGGQLGRGLWHRRELGEVNRLGLKGVRSRLSIKWGKETDLIEDLEPDVLSPVRSNGCQHQSLQLNVAHNGITVHTHASSSGSLTVAVTGASEVI